MTLYEFCLRENISHGTYYLLKKFKIAPKIKDKRISQEDYKDWVRRMEKAAGRAPIGKKRHTHALRLAKIRGVGR